MKATIKNVIGDLCDIDEIVFDGSAQELHDLLAEFGFVTAETKAHEAGSCDDGIEGDESSAFDDTENQFPHNFMELEGAEVLGAKTKFAYLKVSSKEHNDTFAIEIGWMDSLKPVNPNEVMSLLWRALQCETDTSTIEEARVKGNILLVRSSFEGRHFFALRDDIVDWLKENLESTKIKARLTVKDL